MRTHVGLEERSGQVFAAEKETSIFFANAFYLAVIGKAGVGKLSYDHWLQGMVQTWLVYTEKDVHGVVPEGSRTLLEVDGTNIEVDDVVQLGMVKVGNDGPAGNVAIFVLVVNDLVVEYSQVFVLNSVTLKWGVYPSGRGATGRVIVLQDGVNARRSVQETLELDSQNPHKSGGGMSVGHCIPRSGDNLEGNTGLDVLDLVADTVLTSRAL